MSFRLTQAQMAASFGMVTDLHWATNAHHSAATLDDALHKSNMSPFERVRGTTSEHAIDIFTVDKRQRKIYITRIGAGNDRELDY